MVLPTTPETRLRRLRYHTLLRCSSNRQLHDDVLLRKKYAIRDSSTSRLGNDSSCAQAPGIASAEQRSFEINNDFGNDHPFDEQAAPGTQSKKKKKRRSKSKRRRKREKQGRKSMPTSDQKNLSENPTSKDPEASEVSCVHGSKKNLGTKFLKAVQCRYPVPELEKPRTSNSKLIGSSVVTRLQPTAKELWSQSAEKDILTCGCETYASTKGDRNEDVPAVECFLKKKQGQSAQREGAPGSTAGDADDLPCVHITMGVVDGNASVKSSVTKAVKKDLDEDTISVRTSLSAVAVNCSCPKPSVQNLFGVRSDKMFPRLDDDRIEDAIEDLTFQDQWGACGSSGQNDSAKAENTSNSSSQPHENSLQADSTTSKRSTTSNKFFDQISCYPNICEIQEAEQLNNNGDEQKDQQQHNNKRKIPTDIWARKASNARRSIEVLMNRVASGLAKEEGKKQKKKAEENRSNGSSTTSEDSTLMGVEWVEFGALEEETTPWNLWPISIKFASMFTLNKHELQRDTK